MYCRTGVRAWPTGAFADLRLANPLLGLRYTLTPHKFSSIPELDHVPGRPSGAGSGFGVPLRTPTRVAQNLASGSPRLRPRRSISSAAALADRYRIERELGQGGMATVYLAQDLRHDRKVAIKVLRPELAAVIGAERFLSEIRTTANLQHPHILPLFDSGEADGFLFYVMPFVEGESLRDRLNREKQLPIDDAVRIATEVAGALDYAHRHGVIHRDIKPENILLHDGTALVADFGIALAASKAGGDPHDRDRHVARHAALHEPRAGDGRARDHRPDRRLRARRRHLRDAGRASRRSPGRRRRPSSPR